MSGFLQVHTSEWLESFTRQGYPDVEPLAAGVEGAIYRLGDGMVAKVWGRRREPELLRMQNFYADVARAGLPFATPVILRVEEINGSAVTFERELHGEPLQKRLAFEDRELDPLAVDCLVEVVRALADVPGTDSMRQLPVLDEDRPFWAGTDDFPTALIALLKRRVARFGELLRAHVPDFDRRYARILEKLTALDRVSTTVIHGDLFGENILVDEAVRPTAVLDFGFLSTAGDPRLDASISAVIMNMYGPHALAIAQTLTDRFAAELGYPVEVLLVYRAAYAVATSNVFTADGSDGHFPWCVAQLVRAEVTAALDL
jgi:aminoglycoside phosphotransferase (APT) family kinase protein